MLCNGIRWAIPFFRSEPHRSDDSYGSGIRLPRKQADGHPPEFVDLWAAAAASCGCARARRRIIAQTCEVVPHVLFLKPDPARRMAISAKSLIRRGYPSTFENVRCNKLPVRFFRFACFANRASVTFAICLIIRPQSFEQHAHYRLSNLDWACDGHSYDTVFVVVTDRLPLAWDFWL